MTAHRLMLVDDEENVLHALRRILAAPGRELECYSAPEEALRRARVSPFDLIISDFRMPWMNGASMLAEIRELQPDAIRMIISAYADFEAVVSALNQGGVERFIAKPWNDDELQLTVRGALEKRDLVVENRRLAAELRQIRSTVSRHEAELARLEREHPGITRVNWCKNGSIALKDGSR